MQRQLENAYRFYNRKYFNNELPPATDIDLRWDAIAGSTMGMCREDEIVISTKYRKENALWRFTLLHEMAHLSVGVRYGHGKKFQAEMLRLARAGAFNRLW